MEDNIKQHELFYATNYSSNELTVYQQNNLYTKIKEKIPDFSDTDIKLNNYFMYYRTYPKWAIEC